MKAVSIDLKDLKGKISKKIFQVKPNQSILVILLLTPIQIFLINQLIYLSPDYIIGPGDEIIIMLWGQTEDQTTYTVTKDGYISVKNIGQVFVNGLNLKN